jgi:putative methyltransferase (TIGR04325 family)
MTKHIQKAVPGHIWNGMYTSWNEACINANISASGKGAFDSDRWLQRVTQQLFDYRNEYRKFGIAQPPRPCNLPLVCALTAPNSIIDFGGSSGWCWNYLENNLPRNTIQSYTIVELESVVRYMQNSGMHSGIVSYQTLDDTIGTCDILYVNSVLQYFESNESLFSLIERAAPNYIFLEDIIAKGEKDFFSIQTYYDSVIPYRFIGLENLLKDLSLMGYHEQIRSPYALPVLGIMKPLQMENFSEKFQLRYSLSILLSRMQK